MCSAVLDLVEAARYKSVEFIVREKMRLASKHFG